MKSCLLLVITTLLALLGATPVAAAPNALTADERRLGFELLFDGRSFDRWAHNVDLLRVRGWAPPYSGDLAARRGFLRLQYHGGRVWYRSVRLRTIPRGEKAPRSELTEMPMTPEALKIQENRIRGIQSTLKKEVERMDALLPPAKKKKNP
ncbi:MAG: hypothetical protein HY736_27465 [Verrucomicrobia bacterium]|nr:hypothetical protein [Verrucomicrobiota bacterium]